MFKKILLAMDGSKHAKRALEYARDLALLEGAQVVVVYAFEKIPVWVGEPKLSEIVARQVNMGRDIATRAVKELQDADVDASADVLEGPAAQAIIGAAEGSEADLIVMGSRGYGELTSLLLGSVSHRVLAHSDIPVMIVKAEED